MELSNISANAGATVASMALCLPNAGVGVGASTGNSGVIGENETILGPRIDINTHHNGLQANSCGSTDNLNGVHHNSDLYATRQNSSLSINRSLTSNNGVKDIEDAVSGITNDQEVKCSVSVTVQSSTTLKTNCQQLNRNDEKTVNMESELFSSDRILPESNDENVQSFLPSINGLSKMSSNDNLASFCSLLSASVPVMSENGHHAINTDESDFDGIDLGNDEENDSCVPLGEILEKLQAEETVGSDIYSRSSQSQEFSSALGPTTTSTCNNNNENSDNSLMGKFSLENDTFERSCSNHANNDDHEGNNLIRLHAVNDTFHDGDSPTISATVNVATLDLSDPESIHQHLSQLNDTVLRVSAEPFSIRSPSPLLLSNAVTTSSNSETIFDSSTSCSSSNHDVAPLTPVDNTSSSTPLVSGSPSSCSTTSVNKTLYRDSGINSFDTNGLQDPQLSTTPSVKAFEPIIVDIKPELKDGLGVEDMYEDSNGLMPSTTNLIKSPKQSTSTVVGNLVSSLMSPSSQQSPGGSTSSTSTCSSNQVPPIPSPFLTPSTTIALPTSPVPVSISLPSSPCPLGSANLCHSTLTSKSNVNLAQSVSSASPVPPQSPSTQTGTPANTPTTSPMISRRSSGTKSSSSGSQAACAVCFKTFSNASALAKHRLTHSEERRYHCTICSKAFKRQDHLNGHLLTHRSTKPFACHVDGCGKSYCDARSLRRHKENHHNNKNKKDGQQDAGTVNKTATVPTVSNNTIPRPNSQAPNINSPILTINTDKPNIKNIPSVTTTNITNAPEHLITACKSVLGGDTKVKFSSKGLTAHQIQIIQKIFKESKSDLLNNSTPDIVQTNSNSTSATFASANIGEPISSVSLVAAKALAAVQSPPKGPVGNTTNSTNLLQRQKSLDKAVTSSASASGTGTESGKPVECGICNRKFKNVPALNGHMRLHGGYYKKDENGKRIIGLSDNHRRNKGGSMSNMVGKCSTNKIEKTASASSIGSKRKIPNPTQCSTFLASKTPSSVGSITSSGGLSVFPAIGVNNTDFHNNKANQGISGSSLSISPLNTNSTSNGLLMPQKQSLGNGECSNSPVVLTSSSIEPPTKKFSFSDTTLGGVVRQQSSEPPSPSLAFCSLPPPDTNRLLANLELKAAQQQQQLLAIPNSIKTLASSALQTNSIVDTEIVGAVARNTSVLSSNSNSSQNVLKAVGFVNSSLSDVSNKSLQITPSMVTSKSTSNNTISISEIPLQPSGLEISPVTLTSNICPRSITETSRIQVSNCSPAVSLPTMPLPVSSVESSSSLAMRLPANIASLMSSTSLSFPKFLTSSLNNFRDDTSHLQENPSKNPFSNPHGQWPSSPRQSDLVSSSKITMNNSKMANSMMVQQEDAQNHKTTTDTSVPSQASDAQDLNFGSQFIKDFPITTVPKPCNMLKVDNSTDKQPKIGDDHQVEIPNLIKREVNVELSSDNVDYRKIQCNPDIQIKDRMKWNPDLAAHISEEEMCQYLILASSCMVNGGSHNEELALEILKNHSGDIRNATKDLLSPHYDPKMTNENHSKKWTESEVDLFYEGLVKHHKNFHKISSDIKSKSTKDCIEFYYLWKNVCREEAQSFKNIFQVGESFTEVKSLSVQDF